MSSDIVIRVENLSKRYVLKHASGRASGDGLRHAIQDAVTSPFRRLNAKFRKQRSDTSDSGFRSPLSAFQEDFYALRDVSFEVKQGEVLGIIGRNGAGKSTLLKILSRITEPTKGRIGIKGRVASLLEVGTGFHAELTGRENIYLNGAILGMSNAEVRSKFDEIVDFSGVEKFLDTPVKRYSSGMYVRLAFAVAAHLEPEILVVDEVLAVGDAEFQSKCLGKMKQVAERQGRTVLFVSHNMSAIQALCGKTLVLEAGQTLFCGEMSAGMGAYRSSTRKRVDVAANKKPRKAVGIENVSFLGSDGADSGVWDTARSGCFRVKYHVDAPIRKLELSLRLESMTNGSVGTIFAGRSAAGDLPTFEGTHEVQLHLAPQLLVPDEYLVTAWLHDPMVQLYDFQEKVLMIEVVNSASDFAPLGTASLLGASLIDPEQITSIEVLPDHTLRGNGSARMPFQ